MNKEKLRCRVSQQQKYSVSHTTQYFTNWYDAITTTLDKASIYDNESIEIKLDEKIKILDMMCK